VIPGATWPHTPLGAGAAAPRNGADVRYTGVRDPGSAEAIPNRALV